MDIPGYHKTNGEKNYARFPTLDTLILQFHSKNGTDASKKRRVKNGKKINAIVDLVGPCGPVLDIAMRSAVNDMLLNCFEYEIGVLRTVIIGQYFKLVPHPDEVTAGFDTWSSSTFCTNDYDTFLRNSRTDMLNAWLSLLYMKPQGVLLQSLENYNSKLQSIGSIYPKNKSTDGIFGMTG